MVQIGVAHLNELESLFAQSAKGLHLLFDRTTLTEILKKPTEGLDYFTFENMTKVQSVLGEFVAQKTLAQKQTFLLTLDPETYELLVRTYFNIVENAIFESSDVRH